MSGIPLAGTCHVWPFGAQGQFDLPLELWSTSWPRPPQSRSGPVTAMSWPICPSLPEKKHPLPGAYKFDPSILPDLLLGLWRLIGFPFKMNGFFTHCSRVLVTPNQYISIHLRIVMFKGVRVYHRVLFTCHLKASLRHGCDLKMHLSSKWLWIYSRSKEILPVLKLP